MASYSLIGSYSTVQSLSPTITNPVEYCTIQTIPSGAIASMPVQKSVFDKNQAGVELTNFADAIEQILSLADVTAAVGTQVIEDNNLLADYVSFTVSYTSPASTAGAVTAEALVPVGYLNFTDGEIGQASLGNVQSIIGGVYGNLQSAAGG